LASDAAGLLPDVPIPPPGPRSRELAARLERVESPAFQARREARASTSSSDHAPIVYARGCGANVFDVDGNRYVDLTAGFGALVLGYGPNAALEAASQAQGDLPLALGDVYASELKVRAVEAIASLFPESGARVMLGLSGADAVTCALKTAMLATKKPGVVAFAGAYHGLSHGPLAACGLSAAFREPFAQQLGVDVTFAPYPDRDDPRGVAATLEESLAAVRAALSSKPVGAILVEPMLGRGGCVVPPASFLAALRSLADDAGALLLLDEVWTGMGRSGAMLACDLAGVVPDVVCLGKGLGGGVPISACVGRARVMEAWGAHGGSTIHTGTHFGSPAASAAALATLAALRGGLAERAARVGDRFLRELASAGTGAVSSWGARGKGLMIGVTLADAAEALAVSRSLLGRGYVVLTGGVRGDTLTLSPPLTIPEPLLEAFIPALAASVREHRR
jgi:4-aminobutyrate aminotransferase/(S)-3-amino-2-methylpropionate transaminase